MRIRKMTIYKTNLDSEYRNVIDTGPDLTLTKRSYKDNVLDSYYTYNVIYDGTNLTNGTKSFKSVGNKLDVVLSVRCEDSFDYNYAVIENTSGLFFYFIDSIDSLNDGTNPSTVFHLTRDSWAENIVSFTDHNENDLNYVLESHLKRIRSNGDNTFSGNYYLSEDTARVRSKSSLSFVDTHFVAWLGVRFAPNCQVLTGATPSPMIKDYFDGCIPFDFTSKVLFTPIAIVSIDSNGNASFNYSFTYGNGYANTITSTMFKCTCLTDGVLDAFVTLFPPFQYTATASAVTTSGGISWSNYTIFDADGSECWDVSGFYYIGKGQSGDAYNKTFSRTITTPMDNFSATGTIGSVYFDPQSNYDEVKYYDPRLYTYPFREVTFKFGTITEQIPLRYTTTSHSFKIYNKEMLSSQVTTFVNSNPHVKSLFNVLGKLPTTGNRFDNFRLASLQNIITSTITGAVGGLTMGGAIGAGIGAVAGLGTGAIKSQLEYEKLENTTESVSVPDVIGYNNTPLYIPYYSTTEWADAHDVDDIAGKIYRYGYLYNEIKSVKSQNRLWFDYCRTNNCNLKFIKNLSDRKILEDAFNRGVTKWHLQDGFGLNADFNTKKNNVEKEFVSAEDAQISFNFLKGDPACWTNVGTVGNSIVLNDRVQTYNVQPMGIELSEQTGAHISTTADITQYVSFAERANSSIVQLRITQHDTNFTTGGFIATIHRAGGYLYRDANGDLYLTYINYNAYGPVSIGLNISQVIGKTLTFSYYFTGYSTGSKMRVYLDDTQVFEGGYGQYNTRYIGQIGTDINATNAAGVTIGKWRRFYITGEARFWTADEVRTHLL